MYLTMTLDVALQEEWLINLTTTLRCCIAGRMVNVPNHIIRCCITERMLNVLKMYLAITLDGALLKKW